MIKETKNIDFYISGRQPSEKDFARISVWILNNKKKGKTSTIKIRRLQKHTSVKKPVPVSADN